MSSFVAHAVAAFAIKAFADGEGSRAVGSDASKALSRTPLNSWAMLPILGFAWLPDGDYALRLLGFGDPAVRWSHSFAFVIGVWLAFTVTANALPFARKAFGGERVAIAALVAGLSHVVMDWLVASSWGDPLFWPLSAEKLSAPYGIFPWGSSNMDPARLRTWQNLAMELGVLLPIAWAAILRRRGTLTKKRIAFAALIALPFAGWAMSLPR